MLLLQKWEHDAAAWEALPVETQEAVIGRRKPDSVELDDKPADSHVASTDQDDFGNIFRRNMPYGTVTDHGTMFVGFCAEQRPLEAMLESMAGLDERRRATRSRATRRPADGRVLLRAVDRRAARLVGLREAAESRHRKGEEAHDADRVRPGASATVRKPDAGDEARRRRAGARRAGAHRLRPRTTAPLVRGRGCPREREPEEQRERREEDHAAARTATTTATSVSWAAAACRIVRPRRKTGCCASAQPAIDRGDRERGRVARRLVPPRARRARASRRRPATRDDERRRARALR